MQPAGVHAFKLQSHPDSPSPEVRSLNARLESQDRGVLRLRYLLDAHVSRLRMPPPAAPARTDELWRHTCFEAFLSIEGSSVYYELNFSPSSQWALYRFDSYRQGMSATEIATPPVVSVRGSDYRLELDATLHIEEIPELCAVPTVRLALAAVIEAEDGRLSYWALRHAAEKPDFHHGEGFVSLTL